MPILTPREHNIHSSGYQLSRTVVANRGIHSNGYTFLSNGTTDISQTTRRKYLITTNCYGIQVLYGNFTGESATQVDPITITAGFDDGTTICPIFFNGKRAITIDAGGYALSDPLPKYWTKGDTLWVRSCVTVTEGLKWPKNVLTYSGYSGENILDNQDATLSAISAFNGTSQTWCFGSLILYGTSTNQTPCIGLLGDSIQQSGAGSDINLYGLGMRALGTDFGKDYCNLLLAQSGDQAQSFMTNNKVRSLFVPACTSVLSNYGLNETYSGANYTLGTLQTQLTSFWTWLTNQNIKVWQTTISPYTTSTDNWATTGNQTIFNSDRNTVRTQLNDWIRTTPSPLSGYFEVADTVETSRNSGIWKAAPALTGDGIHPNVSGFNLMKVAIDPTKFI